MIKFRFSSERVTTLTSLCFALGLACTAPLAAATGADTEDTPAPAAQEPAAHEPAMDHSGHTMDHSEHVMDHSGHGAGQAGGDDPHAHHRAMMQRQGYQRSERQYPLDEDLRLVDMTGTEGTLGQALSGDRPVMVNFIFTTCTTICPVMSATFAQVQQQLGPDAEKLHMISISIDPEHDTPERLRDYAKRFNAGPQWDFYTGDVADIIAIQKGFDVYRGSKMSHEPTTLMRKSAADPWVRIDGLASAGDIVKEYQQLIGR
jgi:protein SCO1/2